MQYVDNVLDYLEYIGYPEYVIGFEPKDTTASMIPTMWMYFDLLISYRMCAISIFALTMKYQVMREEQSIQ